MADTIYTSQTPATTDLDFITHHLGMLFTVSVNRSVTGGRAWVPSGGRPPTFFWQLWRVSDQVKLAEVNLNSLPPPTANTWMSFTSADFSTPGSVSIVSTDSYIVNVFTDDGQFVFTSPGTFPINNGVITSTTGRFGTGQTQNTFPASASSDYFFADVNVEAGGTTASAGLASGGGVANAPAPGVKPSAGVIGGTGAANQPSTLQVGDVQLYKFGPCAPWDATWPGGECDVRLLTGAAAVTGVAVQAASEILYQLTAQRFGLCRVKLRPCRQSCYSTFPWHEWWNYGSFPQPYWWAGTWYNLACGSCSDDSCSCVGLEQVSLPGPAYDVIEVKVDGVVLVKNVDYRLDDYRKLVRLGGKLWPFCQNMNLTDTQVGTWSATVDYGELVPVIGKLAVGELAAEIVKYLLCLDCQLPQGVVDISRQGISMSISSIAELFNTGFIQLRICDLFIKTANPNHAQARSFVYDIDGPQHRATGTTP